MPSHAPPPAAWLHLDWHARYAHVGLGGAPTRGAAAELYSFGAQLGASLRGLVLTRAWLPTPYERVLRLAFAQRPGEPPAAELVYECMARYSNLLLLGPEETVLAAAHQVGWLRSRGGRGHCCCGRSAAGHCRVVSRSA